MHLLSDLIDSIDDKQKGIRYALTTTEHLARHGVSDNQCYVRAVLVENTSSTTCAMLHALVPHNHVVELDSLNRLLSADFCGSERTRFQSLLEQDHLADIPALPNWQGIPCIVDSEVFFYDTLLLDLGNRRDVLELDRGSFISLIERSLRSKISSPINVGEEYINGPGVEFARRRLKQRIEETLEIPPLRRSAQHIFELRAQVHPATRELCDIIELDPSLAAQVVSWAASPYYGSSSKPVNSIQEAVTDRLGFDMVMNMLLGLALGKQLDSEIFDLHEQDQFSRHSVLTACICETLAQEAHGLDPKLAYTCGLISNLGSVMLSELFPLYKAQIDRILLANPHLRRAQIERYVTGCDSHDVAVWALENWNMPHAITTVVSQCGALAVNDVDNDYSKLILIAQQQLIELGISANHPEPILPSWWQHLGITENAALRQIRHLVRLEGQLYPVATPDTTQTKTGQKNIEANVFQL